MSELNRSFASHRISRSFAPAQAKLLGCALLLLTPLAAPAQVQQVVPYSGQLDLDGGPFTGAVQIRFRLYTDAQAGEGACAAPCVWEEAHPAVQVYAGSFQVRLGAPTGEGAVATPIGPIVQAPQQLWLEMALRAPPPAGQEPSDWVTLAQRQAINPAPQALWSASATELSLTALQITGGITNPAPIADGNVNGHVKITDPGGLWINPGELYVSQGVRIGGGIDNPSAVAVRITDPQGLRVEAAGADLVVANGEAIARDGVRTTVGDVSSARDLIAGRNLSASGALNGASAAIGQLRVNAAGELSDAHNTMVVRDDLIVTGPLTAQNSVTTPRIVVDGTDIRGFTITGPHTTPASNHGPADHANTGVPVASGVCWVSLSRTDGNNFVHSACYVAPSGATWRVTADHDGSGTTTCAARCLRWDQ